MTIKKSNKFIIPHVGRPRKYDLEQEAELLREWADNEENLILREWACNRKYSKPEKMNEYCSMSEEFREAYSYAKTIIGIRRESKAAKGTFHTNVFNRYAAMYDPELKAYDKEVKEECEIKPNLTIKTTNYGDGNRDPDTAPL